MNQDTILFSSLLLILGLAVLTGGAELLVRGASAVAARLGMSPLVIGLTVVAFGTSAPELVVSVKASLAGQGGIAMGNVIGSNIFNVAAILGFSALLCPLAVHLNVIRIDMPVMLGVSLLFSVLVTTSDGLARWEGGVLFAGLIAYITWSVSAGKKEEALEASGSEGKGYTVWVGVLLTLLGLALLVGGGNLFVTNAVAIARKLGWSEAVIGLTVVAAGTSLPEFATSAVAAFRRETDIAIGNIVGSNIFNLLGIAGIAALVRPVSSPGIQMIDLGAMLLTAAVLLPLMRTGMKLVRWEGGVLLAGFASYLWLRWP